MQDDLPDQGPPDAVMRALAGELASLHGVAINLEDCMAEVVQRGDYGCGKSADRQLMQDFDLLTQSLEGLCEFTSQLATAAKGRPSIRLTEALATIKLGDMRDRLANHEHPSKQNLRPPTATEIDLF